MNIINFSCQLGCTQNPVKGKKKIEEESSKDEKLKKAKKEKKGGIKKDFKLIANSKEGDPPLT